MVQLHQLRYVLAVADERNFTRAAERLHLAQPSLSRQVRLLENELGVSLFHRTPGQGPVELTADGAAILPYVRRVLADVDATATEARALAGLTSGRLSIGATPSLATRILPSALVEFHATYPGIELAVTEAGSRDLVACVAEGEVDLALVVMPVAHRLVAAAPLFDDRLVLAVATTHPLAGRRRVRITDLADLPLVMFREGYDLREVTLRACQEAGVAPRMVSQGGEMDGVLALVAAGLGAAVVPEIVVPPDGDIRALPFVPAQLRRTIALAHRSDRLPSRAAVALSATLAGITSGVRGRPARGR